MKEYSFPVPPDKSGIRIDKFLSEALKDAYTGISRVLIQQCIQEGLVKRNGNPLQKPHEKVRESDIVSITIKDKEKPFLEPESIPLEVIYEDDDLAVINKPCGLVVHPAPGNYKHTLVQALLYRFETLSDVDPQRPGIVHRLDKETSGLLVVARNNAAHCALTQQFSEHTIQRTYVAVVAGEVAFDEDVIEAPIGRNPLKREHMTVTFSDSSRYARTRYRTLRRGKEYSLLELQPFTGRTHQLRVHCAFIGHPIIGDAKYGSRKTFKRLALHAQTIGFVHPRTKKHMEFSTDIPPEFLRLF